MRGTDPRDEARPLSFASTTQSRVLASLLESDGTTAVGGVLFRSDYSHIGAEHPRGRPWESGLRIDASPNSDLTRMSRRSRALGSSSPGQQRGYQPVCSPQLHAT